jgi:phosphatidylserine decarboxylase
MIARGGTVFVAAPALTMGLLLITAIAVSSNVFVLLTLPFGILFLAFLVFFRDPARHIGSGIVSPADGRIIEADRDTGRVSIYMGLRNVHVNRAPWSGIVVVRRRRAGGYAVASSMAAAGNHSVDWQIGTLLGEIQLRQIAGMLARRIVPYIDEGARIKKGQKIGLIRFGSRVELRLPPTARIVVAVGDRVRAGETTVAEVEHGFAQEDTPG